MWKLDAFMGYNYRITCYSTCTPFPWQNNSGVARILGRAGLKSVEQGTTFAQQSACALDGPAHISIQ